MENINEKIKKLLSLSSSENKHEAEMALKKANELMLKFNVGRESLQYEHKNYVKEDIYLGKKRPVHTVYICVILQEHFFVSCVITTKKDGKYLTILGEKENVENSVYIYNSLSITFKSLSCGVRSKGAFYLGLREGFCHVLSEQKRKLKEEKGLVVIKDNDLELFKIRQFGGRLSKAKSSYNEDNRAYGEGFQQGKNIKINKRISNNSKQPMKYIG